MDSQITVTMPNIASFWTGIPIINGKTMTVMRLFTIFVRTRKFGKPAVLNIIIECRVSTSIYRIRTMVDSKIGFIERITIISHKYRTPAHSTSLFTSNFVEINVFKQYFDKNKIFIYSSWITIYSFFTQQNIQPL